MGSNHGSTLPLLVANFVNTKWCKNAEIWLKPWHKGTHLRELLESYPMNTNMKGFEWFLKSLHPCALDESSVIIGRVKILAPNYNPSIIPLQWLFFLAGPTFQSLWSRECHRHFPSALGTHSCAYPPAGSYCWSSMCEFGEPGKVQW